MFDTNRIKQDFSIAAGRYDDNALLQQDVLRKLLSLAMPLLPYNANILDAGAGTGQLARELSANSGANKNAITQIDISYNMCMKSAGNGNFAVNGNIESLPFADGSFDVVFSSLALQWLADLHLGIKELKRVLKPGGVIAFSTFGENTLSELRNSFASVDNYQHVSPFIKADDSWRKETVTEYFPSLTEIMRSLKAIGANNKLASRRKTMMTSGKLKEIEYFYRDNFACVSGLPVTWEILYSVKRV